MEGNQRDFSFSGTKTRASGVPRKGLERGMRCLDFSQPSKIHRKDLLFNVADIVKETGAKAFAISGGVAANSLLRKEAESLSRKLGFPCSSRQEVLHRQRGYDRLRRFLHDPSGHTSGLISTQNRTGASFMVAPKDTPSIEALLLPGGEQGILPITSECGMSCAFAQTGTILRHRGFHHRQKEPR